jgi:transcription elongation factor GreA
VDTVILTPGGHARLLARIAAARAAYKAICDDNPAALESGDSSGWHDNFAFEENQRQMHKLARLVRDLEAMAARVTVVPVLTDAPDTVVIGASVTWSTLGGERRSAWIAGHGDGDPSAGRISYDSPLGRQLLGAEVGDQRSVELGGRAVEIEVQALGPTPADG